MFLSRWRNWLWCYLLDDCRHSSFLRSELYSPLASSTCKWSLITSADLRLLLIVRRVTASWETGAAWVFKSKQWKLTLKCLTICFDNPKFFRSSTWSTVYSSSISWHYPFKVADNVLIAASSLHSADKHPRTEFLIDNTCYWILP